MHEELNVNAARALVALSTLGEVQPGDVFYLVSDPSAVWFRDIPDGGYDGYAFTSFAADSWRTAGEVGTGDLRQRVVILHNTGTQKKEQ
ncbi:MAG TPA: hypothetical protein VGG75_38265 [Trebonia sp.]